MRTILLIFSVLMLVVVDARAQSTCPPGHPVVSLRVQGYLTQDNFAAHRRSLGLDGLTLADARLLSDATDLTMCHRLNAQFGVPGSDPNWRWSAYRVRDYYFVAWYYLNTDGGYRIGLTPWLIFDQNFNQVGGFAS